MNTLFSFKYMRIIVATLGVILIVAIGAIAAQALNLVEYNSYATVDVEGVAEITAVPDIGAFNFTVEAENIDVATAQKESGEKINAMLAYLKDEGGVEEKDIKTTGYNTYPRYEYNATECLSGRCNQKRELVGYVVSQNVSVKVRNIDTAGTLVGGVGQLSATNISGLSFEVDDIEALKEEVRLSAIADAREKAKRLAKELDVRLGDIINFNDGGSDGGYPVPYATRGLEYAVSDAAFEEKAFAPEISVGEDTVTARVTITYEIK